jgi:hypothetical protein
MHPGLIDYYYRRGGGGEVPFSPSDLGAKLRHWSEVDGLVVNSTTDNGIVDVSGNVSQLTDLSGNDTHWIQIPGGVSATATRPVLSSGKVVFTAASKNALYSPSLVADIAGNTQGEVILVYKKRAAISAFAFCFGATADASKRSCFGNRTGSPNYTLIYNAAPTANQLWYGTPNGISDEVLAIHSFSSNGAAYKVAHEIQYERLEEDLTTTVGGGNDGDWFSDFLPEYMALFCFLGGTDAFLSGDFHAMIICNEQLTEEERSNVFCYLGNKYNTWL